MRVERRRNLPKAAKVLNLLSLFVDWIEKEDNHIDRKAYLKTSLNVNFHCCCCFRCCQEELPQSTFFPITPTHPECLRRELFPWATHPPYHVSFTIHATVVCPDWEVYLVEFVLVELKNYVDWIIHTHKCLAGSRLAHKGDCGQVNKPCEVTETCKLVKAMMAMSLGTVSTVVCSGKNYDPDDLLIEQQAHSM